MMLMSCSSIASTRLCAIKLSAAVACDKSNRKITNPFAMLGRAALLGRQTARQLVRYAHGHGGIPGENLPFSLENRYKLTAMFIVFFGSGLAAPFLVLRHQLLKK